MESRIALGAVIKNDHEHILMLRKPGGYRSTDMVPALLSMLLPHEMDKWMRPVWSDIREPADGYPAPYPVDMAERLVRMFSFAGDRILDPFGGSGSTALAAIKCGRTSISVETINHANMALSKVIYAARSTYLWGPRRTEVVDCVTAPEISGPAHTSTATSCAIHVLRKPKRARRPMEICGRS